METGRSGFADSSVELDDCLGCPRVRRRFSSQPREASRFSGAPQWIRTTDLVLLLSVSVAVRPVVLAPLALRAPGTLNAGRGGGSDVGLARAARLVNVGARSCRGSGLLLVRVIREGARAAPAPACASGYGGGLSRRLRLLGHYSNQQQALVPVSK